MEPRRATSPLRNALLIVVAGVVATIVVGLLLGAFRSSPPASSTVDGSPLAMASSTSTPAAAVASASPAPPSPDPILIGVGDIATCDHNFDEQTARLIAANDGIVFTLGDNVYSKGTPAEFRDCYDPSWGRVKDRTEFPVPGNHDYGTANAAGYREYFGKRATPDGDTWYSRDVGSWHVIVLDANCTEIAGGCAPGSPQLRWLQHDLAASDARCTLAMWHQPRFSSGSAHGNDPDVAPFWDALYAAGADLVLNGHDHNYERFAPQDPNGNRRRPARDHRGCHRHGRRRDARHGRHAAELRRAAGAAARRVPGHAAPGRLVVPVHLDRRVVRGLGDGRLPLSGGRDGPIAAAGRR